MAVVAQYDISVGKQVAHVKILDDALEKDPVRHQELVDEWFYMLELAVIRAKMKSEAAEVGGA